jgi:hypothetical protein
VAVPADGAAPNAAVAACSRARRGPVTIADGHHRYETALRYRDERRMTARARRTRRSTTC